MLRKRQGYSQEELSEKLNVSRQAVSRWESGTALPDAQNILQLSKIFNVTTDYLLNDYEKEDDLPPVKKAGEASPKTAGGNTERYLIAAIAFIVAAAADLIVAIDRLNIVFVILAPAAAGLSAFWFIQYEKGRKQNTGDDN